jgi:acetylornithine deacetylase/succinyl-diaminopimelate desuccinylase-like protein
MLNVISVMEQLPLPDDPFLGPAVQALTDIISDPYPGYSVIPSRCRVTYDRRLLPGDTAEGVLRQITSHPDLAGIEVHATIAQGEHRTYTGVMLAGPKFFPAWLLTEDHPFVRAALNGLVASGLNPALRGYQFCTNAAYSAGLAGVPTIGFGPGREEDAHVVDERLEIAALIAAERGYRGIIEAVLKDPL